MLVIPSKVCLSYWLLPAAHTATINFNNHLLSSCLTESSLVAQDGAHHPSQWDAT